MLDLSEAALKAAKAAGGAPTGFTGWLRMRRPGSR